MQSSVMVALGGYRFSVWAAGLDDIARETTYRWAPQDVIGGPVRAQFVGPGTETFTLKGTIFPHYRGGLDQVEYMRAEAGLGIPLILVDGTGRDYGDVCIARVGDTKSVFMPDGAPRKIEFSVELVRYA